MDVRVCGMFSAAVLIRLVLLFFGVYQDQNLQLKYTDVDYHVFTDASRFITQVTDTLINDRCLLIGSSARVSIRHSDCCAAGDPGSSPAVCRTHTHTLSLPHIYIYSVFILNKHADALNALINKCLYKHASQKMIVMMY